MAAINKLMASVMGIPPSIDGFWLVDAGSKAAIGILTITTIGITMTITMERELARELARERGRYGASSRPTDHARPCAADTLTKPPPIYQRPSLTLSQSLVR